MPLSPIPEILDELRAGRVVVLVDDENRENEGDFICAAEKISIDLINFMTRVGGGYLCVPLTEADCDRLELGPQASVNTSYLGTPLTVSVDGHPKHGVGTGISAADRVKTIRMLIDPESTASDFVRPGHINPLRARDGGVLVRTGQTEGSLDLARLAGLHPSAVLIEVVNPDGTMARVPDLEKICAEHDLKMCSVEQVIEYRLARESLLERLAPAEGVPLRTPYGTFTLIAFQSTIDPLPHLALTVGGVGDLDDAGRVIPAEDDVLVRMHRRNLLGDIFDDESTESGAELRASMRTLQDAGRGVIVYLRPEEAGDGLRARLQKINRPARDDINAPDLTRTDGVAGRVQPMERRDFGTGVRILRELGLSRVRILTNHPKHLLGLQGFGVEVVGEVPIDTGRGARVSTPPRTASGG